MEIIAAEPELDEEGWAAALEDRGVETYTAKRMVLFAPIAFGRAYLREMPLTFSDFYEVFDRRSPSAPRRRLRLNDAVEYVAARTVADRADRHNPAVMQLMHWGAEVGVATKVHEETGALYGRLGSPVLFGECL